MSLARPIDNSHAAATDLFENFVVAQTPMSVADRNGIKCRFKFSRLKNVRVFDRGLKKTGKTESFADTWNRLTMRTRFC
jgi:hypothetical protein